MPLNSKPESSDVNLRADGRLVHETRDLSQQNELEKPAIEKFLVDDIEAAKEENSFRVASYNILTSRSYVPGSRFYNPETDYKLSWSFRKNLIVQAVKDLDIDVLALQEVRFDQLMFMIEHLPNFGVVAYSEHCGKSLEQIYAESLGEDDVREVVPIMYKKDLFRLIDSQRWYLSDTPMETSIMPGASRPRILVAAAFEYLVDNTIIIVSNTHYDHIASTERLMTSGQLEHMFLEEYKSKFDATDIIYMGDRNSFIDISCDGNQWYSTFRDETHAEDIRNIAPHFGAAATFIGYDADQFKTPYDSESDSFMPRVLDTIFYRGPNRVTKSLNSLVEYQEEPTATENDISIPAIPKLLSFFGKPKNPESRNFASDHSCVMADIEHKPGLK